MYNITIMVIVDKKGYVFGCQAGRNEFPFQEQLSPSTFNIRPQLSHITLNSNMQIGGKP